MKTATAVRLARAAARKIARVGLVLLLVSIAAANRRCPAATGGGLSDYVAFGGHQITISSSLNVFNAPLALAGSNGDISFDSGTVRGTQFVAGGSLVGNPSFLTANSLIFNGNVQFTGLTNISGNVDAGGTANIGAAAGGNVTANGAVTVGGTVNGNVATNHSVTLPTFGQVNGNVQAAQDVTMQSSTTIQGNVTYGGTLSRSGFTTIGGTITHAPSSASPISFSPLSIPASAFSAGGPDISIPVFGTAAPAPGSYGAVSIDGGTLELSPGKYFFNSVVATSAFMNLNLRLDKAGDIELYVLGDYNIPLQVTEVNGMAVSAADAALASRVFVESHGNVFVGWDNLGTLYAPAGDVALDSLTDLWGHPALAATGPRMPCPDLARLAEQLPQYEFHELLGGGATGWVYRARQKSLDRWVAIKLLPNLPLDRSEAVARFQQEAQILAKLNHARIVTVFDYGVTDDARYLVMELVAGPTLRQEMNAAPFEPADGIRMMDEVCEAIELAHSRGITHRDLKPENVIFESSDRTGHIKVADFGISRLVGQVQHPVVSTRTSLVMGTPYYVAPEQMRSGATPDHRADIFAIGVMLYELLTGQLPMGRFARPSRISGAPPAIDAVVMQCLESDPEQRFPDVASLRRALSAAGRGAVSSARRIGLVACAAIVLALALWGVRVVLTRTPLDLAQTKAEPAVAAADSKTAEENADSPKPTERRDTPATRSEPAAEKPQKPDAVKQPSEDDVFVSSVQAAGRYPRATEFQLECHLKNPELATTKDSKLVYVVRSQTGRKLEAPLAFPEGRRDITVRNDVTIHPMDRWPLEFFIEEQWQKPSPGARRASNVFRVEWYEVPMTMGY